MGARRPAATFFFSRGRVEADPATKNSRVKQAHGHRALVDREAAATSFGRISLALLAATQLRNASRVVRAREFARTGVGIKWSYKVMEITKLGRLVEAAPERLSDSAGERRM